MKEHLVCANKAYLTECERQSLPAFPFFFQVGAGCVAACLAFIELHHYLNELELYLY